MDRWFKQRVGEGEAHCLGIRRWEIYEYSCLSSCISLQLGTMDGLLLSVCYLS